MTTNSAEITLVMPKLGLTMTEATLTRWLKTAGEPVVKDEILFEFESDKSLMEYECPATGVLGEILVPAGQTVPCGTPLARLKVAEAQGQRVAKTPTAEAQSRKAAEAQPLPPLPPAARGSAFSPQPSLVATPAAKRLARERGLDLAALAGRGPNGRIQLADVEAAAGQPPAISQQPPVTGTPLAKKVADDMGIDWRQVEGSGSGGRVRKDDVLQAAAPAAQRTQPLSGIRGVIASRMAESAFSAPHVTLFAEADATALVEARRQLNAELGGTTKISYNALLIAIVARLLPEHPALNACLKGNAIHFYDDINIGLAVDTERGLLVPVIRQANRLDLLAIQRSGDALIERAAAGKSQPDDLTGGTFTLTNLGMFDVDGFTPIINQPQSAILGVGRIAAKAVVAASGEIVARQMLTLSLSFDHRIVDGAPAARFLQRVKQLIERPFALLLRQ
ncbi:MAG: Dihydrolipoyllysine-residue acetyltransferase component of pyruvate dehydrogenase complex [Anaerolineae bacterium]|nr:Dihydrolipoyllysine-residue acetyltransferase component of pyruvate dehydrogenase complex [Anaerolineae bacterium]